MLVVAELERVFIHKIGGKPVTLTDPDQNLSAQAVQTHYSMIYPELLSAKLKGPEINNDKFEYTFETSMGTKG